MRITFVGHASILIEVGGVTILSDPWWDKPCFGAQWWNYPPADTSALRDRAIDYIYISHGHHDHFHPGTLRSLDHTAKVLVSSSIGLAPHVSKLGFETIEIDDDQLYTLARGVTCRIMETHNLDTHMAVSDGDEVCLNLNDALHAAPGEVQSDFVGRLKKLYPRIDYVFCGYGVASHFPNCYVIPGKDQEATAAKRQQYFNRQWAKLIAGLAPRYGFPFAADVVFFESALFWANEPTHNNERPTDTFRGLYRRSAVSTLDIAPGFAIRDGRVEHEVLRQHVDGEELRASCKRAIRHANRYAAVDDAGLERVTGLLRENLAKCAEYLKTYPGDYRFLIRFHNSERGVAIEKRRAVLKLAAVPAEVRGESRPAYDVVFTTRLPYLVQSLTSSHGDEVLFVGSGGVFEYADAKKAKRNLHLELMTLLKKHTAPPRPRYGNSSRPVYRVKQLVKYLLGETEVDLYDLRSWTVFGEAKKPLSARRSRRAGA